MPKTVLREQLEDQVEEDEKTMPDYDLDYDDSIENALRENHVYSESPKMAVAGGRHNSSNHGSPPATEGALDPAFEQDEDFNGICTCL